MNQGKVFEQSFSKSVPNYALLYRLPDPAQSFDTQNNLRFSRKNPFDFILWDSNKHILYALEMKTVSGKSISFERKKEDKGMIHYHQICGLNKWNTFDGITCGIIVEFRQIEKTVFIDIEQMNRIMNVVQKKSFSFDDLDDCDIKYTIIEQKLARARYTYDVDNFLRHQ